MRTPKCLLKLAGSNCTVEILTYRNNGMFQTGFAIVDGDKNELLEVEPVYYHSSGYRWYVKNKCTKTTEYLKTLRGFKTEISPMHTGYKFNSLKY